MKWSYLLGLFCEVLLNLPSIIWSYTLSSHETTTSNMSLLDWNRSGVGLILRFLSNMCSIPFCLYLTVRVKKKIEIKIDGLFVLPMHSDWWIKVWHILWNIDKSNVQAINQIMHQLLNEIHKQQPITHGNQTASLSFQATCRDNPLKRKNKYGCLFLPCCISWE